MGADELGRRIAALPGMGALLPALEGLPPAYLVGGAVRDALLGAREAHLDLAIEGDAIAAARVLAERLGGRLVEHERFGTAILDGGTVPLDIAGTRLETYTAPGALPEVEPAGLQEDLARRDYSVNAMAVPLGDGGPGPLVDPHGGVEDARAGRLRVLHAGSFADDPTRILRGLRYRARLGFEFDEPTLELARQAIGSGAIATLSADRVGQELMLLLAEPGLEAATTLAADLGLDRALHPARDVTGPVAARAAAHARDAGARPEVAALATLATAATDDLAGWVGSLGLEAQVRDDVLGAAEAGPRVAEELASDPVPSALYGLLHGRPAELQSLALALGAPSLPVERYRAELRDVALEISGDDLLAAGLAESPAIGRALRETLARKLDGELAGRAQELEAALELARGER
jgi:tRNA nucleotidyltransferase (CCA-adding enzyme)